MNVFRILGDVSHLLAMIILIVKIWRSKSCAGRYYDYHYSLLCLAEADEKAIYCRVAGQPEFFYLNTNGPQSVRFGI